MSSGFSNITGYYTARFSIKVNYEFSRKEIHNVISPIAQKSSKIHVYIVMDSSILHSLFFIAL